MLPEHAVTPTDEKETSVYELQISLERCERQLSQSRKYYQDLLCRYQALVKETTRHVSVMNELHKNPEKLSEEPKKRQSAFGPNTGPW